MTIGNFELNKYLNELLNVPAIKDYAPNGLQVQGTDNISTLVTGVTASLALIEKAIEINADAIVVHHGYFWKSEDPQIVGMKYQRIKSLIKNDINLYGYHLPLDVHPQLGNNVQLCQLIHSKVIGPLSDDPNIVGVKAEFDRPVKGTELALLLEKQLGFKPVHVPSNRLIKTIGICTGGAQGYITAAADNHCDAYLTGEISEPTVHIAMERDIHFFAAGHHATEKGGVKALGEHLADKFNLDIRFIDLPIPV